MPNNVKTKVLRADDERVIANTLAMILNQSGIETRAVYLGEKALELAESFRPDMLNSGVIMADLNGIGSAVFRKGCHRRPARRGSGRRVRIRDSGQAGASSGSAEPPPKIVLPVNWKGRAVRCLKFARLRLHPL